MAEYTNSNGASRPPGRGGRGRRRPGGNPNRNGNSNYADRERSPRREQKTPPPSGFQKFLHAISFGLLGKSGAKKSYSSTTGNIQPQRTPRVESAERQPRPERSERPERGPRPERSERPREARPPRQHPTSAEVTGEKLYVGNLSYDASESDLFELFQGAGRVKNSEVVVNSRTQRSKGFAFVTMMSIDEAKKAVDELNGKEFMGRPLVVGGAKPMTPRDEQSSNSQEEDPSAQAEETASA